MNINNPTLRWRVLGNELRILRKQACLTLNDIARVLHCSESRLSRLESGYRSAPTEEIAFLLGLYHATPADRNHLLTLARDADKPDWKEPKDPTTPHHQHILHSLESDATQIISFDPVVIPRLWQTEKYRNALQPPTRPNPGTHHDRYTRCARRQPPALHAFVEERVLHRSPGNPEILAHQLDHLRDTAADIDNTLRVIPQDRIGATHPFTFLRLHDRAPVVVLEFLTCRLYLERPEDIDTYEHALKHLDNNAPNETESVKLISQAAETLNR